MCWSMGFLLAVPRHALERGGGPPLEDAQGMREAADTPGAAAEDYGRGRSALTLMTASWLLSRGSGQGFEGSINGVTEGARAAVEIGSERLQRISGSHDVAGLGPEVRGVIAHLQQAGFLASRGTRRTPTEVSGGARLAAARRAARPTSARRCR